MFYWQLPTSRSCWEKHAMDAMACAHVHTFAEAFRSVTNHTCKSKFWLYFSNFLPLNCLGLIKICAYSHVTGPFSEKWNQLAIFKMQTDFIKVAEKE